MAESNRTTGGGKHGIDMPGAPEIDKSTDLTESVETMSSDHKYPSRFSKAPRALVAKLVVFVALTLPLAACNAAAASTVATPTTAAGTAVSSPAVPTGSPTGLPAITTPLTTDTPATANTSTPTSLFPTTVPTAISTPLPVTSPTTPVAIGTATTGTPASSAVVSAIQAVIQRGNQEEQQAVAAHDPTLMRDTSTTTYYNQIVQAFNDLVSSGVTAIKLTNLSWGPVTMIGPSTAQASTSETWSTTFADGSVLQSTDANIYTLVQQNGAWLIQDDQHPNSRALQPPTGNPGSVPTPGTPIATIAPGQSSSRNWSGYAATGGTFTSVSGTWTVPNVAAGNTSAADATWVGIGGVSTKDLIQAGTDATVQGGQVVYTAWWETLPQSSQPVPLTVSAGDTVSVSITQQSNGTWQIVIRDATNGQSWQNNVTYQSSLSSAEWVEESPSVGRRLMLPLDNFGTVTFSGATTVENGQQLTAAQAGGQPIIMTNTAGQALAQPSALGANGSGFTVTRTGVTAPRVVPGSGYVPNNTLAGTVPAILTGYYTTASTTAPELTPAPAPQTLNNQPGGHGATRWIDVNIATETLQAYEGDRVVFQTLISGGVAAHPTVKGTFHIFQKLVADDMRGGSGASAYYLPNVPYVMYFAEGGYALHGTYWHHNFGHPMSHGCVNLATPDAKWLYNWAPLGTTVVVH